MDQRNSTILIADGDEHSRYLLRSLLDLKGFQVLEANNGQKAIETSVSRRPNLLVIQLKLPVVSGFTVIRRVRKHEELRAIPIIAISFNKSTIESQPRTRRRLQRTYREPICIRFAGCFSRPTFAPRKITARDSPYSVKRLRNRGGQHETKRSRYIQTSRWSGISS